jgi:acyl-CoA hydrolase
LDHKIAKEIILNMHKLDQRKLTHPYSESKITSTSSLPAMHKVTK